MKTEKIIWIFFWMLVFPLQVFTQNQSNDQDVMRGPEDRDYIENPDTGETSQQKLDIKHNKPLNFNYFTGINILFPKGIGPASSFCFGANASYPVAPGFTVELGAAMNFLQLTELPSGLFPENPASEANKQITNVVLYAKGNYLLSSRMTLSGMAFKQFSPFSSPSVSPYFLNHNQEGMSIEMNYRLFQNFNIGAQFRFIRNGSPFYPSRLTQPVFDNYYR
ncbi:MAG: hypothetical protein JW723_05435 [Bacteroidales bacterium]|nr:hypothetical protein [Bacteroidales bacterium]